MCILNSIQFQFNDTKVTHQKMLEILIAMYAASNISLVCIDGLVFVPCGVERLLKCEFSLPSVSDKKEYKKQRASWLRVVYLHENVYRWSLCSRSSIDIAAKFIEKRKNFRLREVHDASFFS